MACRPFKVPGGWGIACGGRGILEGKNCSACGTFTRPYLLCDWKLHGAKEGQTCDRVLCRVCAKEVAPGKDLCPPHVALWDKHPKNPKNQGP